MQYQPSNKNGSPFLWVGPGSAPAGKDVLEQTAGAFDLSMHYCSYDDLPQQLGAASWKLVAVDIGQAPEQGLERLKSLRKERPRLCIIAAADQGHVDVLPQALRSGANDFVSLPLSTTELNKALIKFSQQAAEVPEVDGEIVSVYGARGGLGATTLAISLAAELGRLGGGEAGLLDLDVFRGDVTACLELDEACTMASISELPSLDQNALGGALAACGRNLLVLQAPPTAEQAELVTREFVGRALDLLKARCRFTVIDTARLLTDVTLGAFEMSDRIVLMTDLSIPGVRAAQRTLDLLARFDVEPDRVEVVMTEFEKSGIKLEEVSKALGKSSVTTMPRDPNVFVATKKREPIAADGSPFGATIANLARKLNGDHARAASSPLFKRLFSLGRS